MRDRLPSWGPIQNPETSGSAGNWSNLQLPAGEIDRIPHIETVRPGKQSPNVEVYRVSLMEIFFFFWFR